MSRSLAEEARGAVLSEALEKWAVNAFKKRLDERLRYYSGIIGVAYKGVRIKSQKTRWGSCSSKGNLNFNWRLIMAPDWIFDYIVVHELCHLRHLNHSKDFWNTVGQYMPDYRAATAWLKKNGATLLQPLGF